MALFSSHDGRFRHYNLEEVQVVGQDGEAFYAELTLEETPTEIVIVVENFPDGKPVTVSFKGHENVVLKSR